MKVGILFDKEVREHILSRDHYESPKRIDIISDELENISNDLIDIKRSVDFFPDVEDFLLCVHPKDHVNSGKCSPRTYKSAIISVQIALSSVKYAFDNKRHVFGLTRPPGHHAYDGGFFRDNSNSNELPQGEGFCFFNNIAIAATYAGKNHSSKKILIVDWDFHFGNGTMKAFFDIDGGTIKRKSVSAFDIYFFSIHGAKKSALGKEIEYPNESSCRINYEDSKNFIHNAPVDPALISDDLYAKEFTLLQSKLIEAKFYPDIILVSAGFDARKDDPVSYYSQEMGLTKRAYSNMTKSIVEISKMASKNNNKFVPIVSLLEGGYNVVDDGFGDSFREHILELSRDQ